MSETVRSDPAAREPSPVNAGMTLEPNDTPSPAAGVYYWETPDQSEALLVKSLEESRLLNSSGRMIWSLCDGNHCIKEILETISEQYGDADKKTLAEHLVEFLDELYLKGYLILNMTTENQV